jgi:hypothetical protein
MLTRLRETYCTSTGYEVGLCSLPPYTSRVHAAPATAAAAAAVACEDVASMDVARGVAPEHESSSSASSSEVA